MLSVFPSRSFTVDLPISTEEAMARVTAAVTPRRTLRWSRPTTTFEGTVTSDTFEIMRAITHRNSFNPWITGRIVPTETGCCVEGTMALPPLVRGFMTLWHSLVLYFGCSMLLSPAPHTSRLAGLLPFGMFLFGIGLGQFGFRMDAGEGVAALEAVLREPAGTLKG